MGLQPNLGLNENTMPIENEKDNPKPLTEYKPSQLDEGLEFAVSAKGAISVRGLQRFPVTLYFEQWKRIADIMPEILEFGENNANLLSKKENAAGKALDKTETYGINQSDIAILAKEVERLTAANDVPGAVKYATIKATAEQNKNRVSPEAMVEIMTLKARK